MTIVQLTRSILLSFLLLSPMYGENQSEIPLFHIPFRLTLEPTATLDPADLTLTINGRTGLIKRLGRQDTHFTDDPGKRTIILAVAGGRHSEEIARFLDTLYREIMVAGDRLILCTPLGSEPFDRSVDAPEPKLKRAQDRLREDLTISTTLQDKLEKNLAMIRKEISGKMSDSKWLSTFNRYEPLAKRMIDQLLAAYLAPLGQAFEQVDHMKRPIWLLLLDEDLPLTRHIGWPLFEADDAAAMKPGTRARIDQFAQRLQSAQEAELGELADEMMLRRIHLLGFNTRDVKSETPPSTGLLGVICRRNGLQPIPFTRSPEAVTQLKNHHDTLWELLTPFDGLVEEKRLNIQFNSIQSRIAHPLKIRAEAFSALAGQPPAPLVIESVSIEENQLVCRIRGISMKENHGGRLRVRVRIQDETNTGRFDQEKELEANQPTLTIRLALPGDIQGYLSLTVDVLDVENRRQDQKRVYVKR